MDALVEERITPEQSTEELGRFFQIAADRVDRGLPTPMFSAYIDATWHKALTNRAKFSIRHAGEVLEHQPDKGRGVVPWVRDYEQRFGSPLPAVWFAATDGTVDEEAWAAYRTTGEIVASWDCSPTKKG